ncbi:MAG TPA: ADP-ribosylglycohydrolase family protein [Rhodothermales bacterium]|nr:ADP-ribosylglycohydrolase family protein [Rhodothermales bacterium]
MPRTLALILCLLALAPAVHAQTLRISRADLLDKIKGGWAGQTIGVTFGGPTEFRFNGTMIQDYQPIAWHDGLLKWWYDNGPGLYDDIYMDLTFVDVLEKQGLDAPATAFADAFAHAGYALWHANQQARYNILNGLQPPASGNWLNNPEADDIDFQIESDFAGLMSPGMPNAASAIADTVGHIMNSGDGWYGGVFISAMYTFAFFNDDVEQVVRQALRMIPEQTTFRRCIQDVLDWHQQYPDDWKRTWFEIQKKWSSDVGCPDGVFTDFDIDSKLNAAYVVLGLLYGDGDFGKTLDIATRAGQDSDCNPSSAGGILGVIKGYSSLPAFWKQGLDEIESVDFKYTTISLDDVYGLSFKHALANVQRHGGEVEGDDVVIRAQPPQPVQLEQNFVGHYPVERRPLGERPTDETTLTFDGIGFAIRGEAVKTGSEEKTLTVETYIDGKLVDTSALPTSFTTRKYTPFFRYQLTPGAHQIRLKVLNPDPNAYVRLDDLIVYSNEPLHPLN